eukprot:1612382-Rhodomonas_salina.1
MQRKQYARRRRTHSVLVTGKTKQSILDNPDPRQLPKGIEWKKEPPVELDRGHTNTHDAKMMLGTYHDGSGYINSEGVATPTYAAGGRARRMLLGELAAPHAPSRMPAVIASASERVRDGELEGVREELLPSESVSALKSMTEN